MTITVTQKHIKEGKRNDIGGCPIALAAREQTKDSAFVWLSSLSLVIGGRFQQVRLPRRASKFVDLFDSGRPVKPFKFRLPTP